MEKHFWELQGRSPDANSGSLLSLSIRREGKVGNNVLPITRRQDRLREKCPLCCSPRDGCFIFALLWAGLKLVRQSDELHTRKKWKIFFVNERRFLIAKCLVLRHLTGAGYFKSETIFDP